MLSDAGWAGWLADCFAGCFSDGEGRMIQFNLNTNRFPT